MNEWVVQIGVGIFLFIITALMAWIATTVWSGKEKVGLLEQAFGHMSKTIDAIANDVKILGNHSTILAVMDSEQKNMKNDINILFEKTKNLEKNEIVALHRR